MPAPTQALIFRVRELAGPARRDACDLQTRQVILYGKQTVMSAEGTGYFYQPATFARLQMHYSDGHDQATVRNDKVWLQSDAGVTQWRLAPQPAGASIPAQLLAPGTDATMIADVYRALSDAPSSAQPRLVTVVLEDGTRGRLYALDIPLPQLAKASPGNAIVWTAYMKEGFHSLKVRVTEPSGDGTVVQFSLPVYDRAKKQPGLGQGDDAFAVDIQASCSWKARTPQHEVLPTLGVPTG